MPKSQVKLILNNPTRENAVAQTRGSWTFQVISSVPDNKGYVDSVLTPVQGLFLGFPVFLPLQKTTVSNSISMWTKRNCVWTILA